MILKIIKNGVVLLLTFMVSSQMANAKLIDLSELPACPGNASVSVPAFNDKLEEASNTSGILAVTVAPLTVKFELVELKDAGLFNVYAPKLNCNVLAFVKEIEPEIVPPPPRARVPPLIEIVAGLLKATTELIVDTALVVLVNDDPIPLTASVPFPLMLPFALEVKLLVDKIAPDPIVKSPATQFICDAERFREITTGPPLMVKT